MTKHKMETLRFLLFYICSIVIAAPPLNPRAPPSESSSYSDSNLAPNLTQTAANDPLLNLFPSSPSTKLSLSSITKSSVGAEVPPNPFVLPTTAGDVVIFGVYSPSPWASDLLRVVTQAADDAILHLVEAFAERMPPSLTYSDGYALLTLQVGPHLNWTRWACALKVIGIFQAGEGGVSFDFEIALDDLSESLGTGQLRTY